jgi:hypothetical protein
MADTSKKPHFDQPIDRAHYTSDAQAQKFSQSSQAWIATTRASIEVLDERGCNLAFASTESRCKQNRFESKKGGARLDHHGSCSRA